MAEWGWGTLWSNICSTKNPSMNPEVISGATVIHFVNGTICKAMAFNQFSFTSRPKTPQAMAWWPIWMNGLPAKQAGGSDQPCLTYVAAYMWWETDRGVWDWICNYTFVSFTDAKFSFGKSLKSFIILLLTMVYYRELFLFLRDKV